MANKICECGCNWWHHVWSHSSQCATRCTKCQGCSMYEERGTGCFWIARLMYNIGDKAGINMQPILYTWIGDGVRHAEKQSRAKK